MRSKHGVAILVSAAIFCAASSAQITGVPQSKPIAWRLAPGKPAELKKVIDAQPRLLAEQVAHLSGIIASIDAEIQAARASKATSKAERDAQAAKMQELTKRRREVEDRRTKVQRGDIIATSVATRASKLKVGFAGPSPDLFPSVFQVIDQSSALVKLRTTMDPNDNAIILVTNVDTTNWTNDTQAPIGKFLFAAGTDTYETVVGTNTVLRVIPFELTDFIRAER